MAEHSSCRATLTSAAKHAEEHEGGARVDVTAVDPLDPLVASFRCPHGVRYWLVPTGEVAS